MRHQKFELHVSGPDFCKTLKDPNNEKIKHIESLLSFEEVNKLRRGNANVRPPEQNRRPYKAMEETVEYSPQLFHIKNRGITYICTDADYDRDKGVIHIKIPDIADLKDTSEGNVTRAGIADGGHTFEVIKNTIANLNDFKNISNWQMPFVRVHFLVSKEQEDIESVVEALNTSSQVQQYSLDEYQNKFQILKSALNEAGFDPDLVAWRENEDKDWHVIEIIQRMACFLKDRWVGRQPLNMYKSKGKALKEFTNPETRGQFKALFPVIKDIITLPEYIQSRFSTGGLIDGRSLAKLKCVKVLKKPYTRAGTDYSTNHRIDLAGLLPLASGFRELLTKKGDVYEWRLPYKEVFDYCWKDLYNLLVRQTGQATVSSALGTDVEFWSGAVLYIMRAKDELSEGRPFLRKKNREEVSPINGEEGHEDHEEEHIKRRKRSSKIVEDAAIVAKEDN